VNRRQSQTNYGRAQNRLTLHLGKYAQGKKERHYAHHGLTLATRNRLIMQSRASKLLICGNKNRAGIFQRGLGE
jgi:hypothetical protein